MFAKEFHKENKRDFAGICHGMKHAFATKNFAECDAIESAHELIILRHFEAMGQANSVEFAIRFDDFFGDPSIAGSERRTPTDHGSKVAVDAGLEYAFTLESRQIFGHFESMMEGSQSTLLWGMPKNLVVFDGVGHRKRARQIGLYEEFGR